MNEKYKRTLSTTTYTDLQVQYIFHTKRNVCKKHILTSLYMSGRAYVAKECDIRPYQYRKTSKKIYQNSGYCLFNTGFS